MAKKKESKKQNPLEQQNKDYIASLKKQAALGSEDAIQKLQSLGQQARIPDADWSSQMAQYMPGTGEVSDVMQGAQALSKGNLKDAALFGLGALIPGVSGKAVKNVFSGKMLRHGKVPVAQQHEYAENIIKGVTNVGKKLDKSNFNARKLTKENVKVIGEKYGRPIVEVDIGGGQTQMFYKSTGRGGKLNEAGESTAGMWQPYGGHMDRMIRGENAKDWFIKNEGYKDFYGSKSFRDIAGNLDRILN
jgi:hypothetical protein